MVVMLDKNFFSRHYPLLIVGWTVLLSVITAGIVFAQVSMPSDDEVNRIASQLFCPICDNMPLDVCPIEACQQWRELIRDQLAEGWSDGEIKAYFVAQYGDRVLGEPPRTGLNWLLYLVPPAVILAGFVLLFTKMKRQPQGHAPQEIEHVDPYLEQVERDLGNLDQTS
jgi:cytochrome c-type biogenesis protein CcmH